MEIGRRKSGPISQLSSPMWVSKYLENKAHVGLDAYTEKAAELVSLEREPRREAQRFLTT